VLAVLLTVWAWRPHPPHAEPAIAEAKRQEAVR
jgi:hypothetical protein